MKTELIESAERKLALIFENSLQFDTLAAASLAVAQMRQAEALEAQAAALTRIARVAEQVTSGNARLGVASF